MRILIVDDSRAMRSIIRRIIEQGDHTVVGEAESGPDALDQLAHLDPRPEIVLLDWHMEGMNGLEVVQHIRADRAYDDVRIIMCTTEAELENVMDAISSGADEYIMKPFTKDVLDSKLALIGSTPA